MRAIVELDMNALKGKRLFLTIALAIDEADDEHLKYLIEEHQCPGNLLASVHQVMVVDQEEGYIDGDYHGLFKYVTKDWGIIWGLEEGDDGDKNFLEALKTHDAEADQ